MAANFKDRAWVPDVPLKVYFYFLFYFFILFVSVRFSAV